MYVERKSFFFEIAIILTLYHKIQTTKASFNDKLKANIYPENAF
jgi:hypothetical protein